MSLGIASAFILAQIKSKKYAASRITTGDASGLLQGGPRRTGSRAAALLAVRRAAVKRGARTEASYALQRCDVAFPRAPDLNLERSEGLA